MLQQLLQQYFATPQDVPIIELTVGTHDANRDNSKFRASDAGKCHRMRYWKRQGKAGKQDIPFETQMAMQTGNLLHAFIQYALNREGVLLASEQELQDEHRIGHFDAILRDTQPSEHYPMGQTILYDFKTVGGKQMYYLKQDRSPKPEHVAQIRTYYQMSLSDEKLSAFEIKIDACRIAYISRDTLEILDLPVTLNLNQVADDWITLYGLWERQETPPMTRNNWECKYCQYNAECLG